MAAVAEVMAEAEAAGATVEAVAASTAGADSEGVAGEAITVEVTAAVDSEAVAGWRVIRRVAAHLRIALLLTGVDLPGSSQLSRRLLLSFGYQGRWSTSLLIPLFERPRC